MTHLYKYLRKKKKEKKRKRTAFTAHRLGIVKAEPIKILLSGERSDQRVEIFIERTRRAERPLQWPAWGLYLQTFDFYSLKASVRLEHSGRSSLAFAIWRMWGLNETKWNEEPDIAIPSSPL